jgi:hypothetical protein
MSLRLVVPPRRICVACETGKHEDCEPIPAHERGLAEGTAYVDCRCVCDYGLPSWGMRKYDSERRT